MGAALRSAMRGRDLVGEALDAALSHRRLAGRIEWVEDRLRVCQPLDRRLRAKVYFIAAHGRVKIGTSVSLERVRDIAALVPGETELIGAMHGGMQLESALHRALARWNIHHEWFHVDCLAESPLFGLPSEGGCEFCMSGGFSE